MKKLLALLLALFTATMCFAANGAYVVKSVKGDVQYESAPGKFSKVKVGQEISASTVIKTNIGAALEVTFDGKDYTIDSQKTGTIESLVKKVASAKKGGLKKATIAKADDEDNASGNREGVSTAAERSNPEDQLTWPQ